ncbi:MAG TPA: peptide MFS transporter [Pyrinomonadaceae bacterium]|jgi:POT family proton-dependent oligopeptide transporter|nr:peptide MFS transporter [Pyrinomonadaceae bacterium]
MSARADELHPGSGREFFGHPKGLSTLFMTEMWERLSYYGMRAILLLYMTAELEKGGLGWDTRSAAAIYGLYTSSVWFLPLIGGWIADRYIGARRATLIGGIVIMLGHFLLAFSPIGFFYGGLICVSIGTGFLKSNISKMVGDLYTKDDDRRDAGFSIFYMGINTGSFLAPFVCGTLAVYNWHWGFAAAGVGMALGVIQYFFGLRNLAGVGDAPAEIAADPSAAPKQNTGYIAQMVTVVILTVIAIIAISSFVGNLFPSIVGKDDNIVNIAGLVFNFSVAIKYVLMPTVLVAGLIAVLLTGLQDKLTRDDWKRIGIILVLFVFATIFWMGFEQAGSSLNLFADQITNRFITATREIPTAWFQSVQPLFIIVFAPIFAAVWIALGKRQPSEEIKFVIGLILTGLGFVILAYASSLFGGGKVSMWWLVIVYLLHTWGELCISPVGLSAMTKLAPGKMVSLMLGVWFLSISMGSYFGGIVAGNFEPEPATLVGLFGKVAAVLIVGGIILLALTPFIRKLYTQSPDIVPVEPA